jgi:hypothetical protein
MQKDVETILQDEMMEFCQRWNIRELALFGSVLREDFGASSDVDILVTFSDDSNWGLFEHMKIEKELEQLLGRKVDLISKRAVRQSPNWLRRKAILESARVLFSTEEAAYAAG